jgi:polygalacturonase
VPAVRRRALALPLVAVLAATMGRPLHAQDTRTVERPTVPAACIVLPAALSVARGDSTLAESDESRLDTQRIQAALDRCARPNGAKRAVVLRARGAANAFLSGALGLRSNVTLVIDSGVTLFASRDPTTYEIGRGACGVVAKTGRGCHALLDGSSITGAGVMGPGTIDGRGWATMLGRDSSWWDVAEAARKGGSQNNPRLVQVMRGRDFTMYDVTLRNGPMFHVYFNGDGFTAWGVTISTPRTARNTDGIDPAAATNVTITHSSISTGDDHVAIKAGAGPTSNVTVSHNHFYTGHGMSIGSETNAGVSHVRVTDLSIDGADDGLRIKSDHSRGGAVQDVVYEDVCIRETKEPLVFDTYYSTTGPDRGQIPVFTGIVVRDVRVLTAGRVTFSGYETERPLGITLDGVRFDDAAGSRVRASHATVTLGAGGSNLAIAGDDVRVSGVTGTSAIAKACDAKFIPRPTR